MDPAMLIFIGLCLVAFSIGSAGYAIENRLDKIAKHTFEVWSDVRERDDDRFKWIHFEKDRQ